MFEIAKAVCITCINSTNVTDEYLRNVVNQVTSMPMYNGVDKYLLFEELSTMYSIRVEQYRILEDRERRTPWLREFKANHNQDYWKFWNRYKIYLSTQKKFAPDIIQKTDELTDSILDGLFNPNQQDIVISKKGLVVGQVQSGKTANYVGLICKAADAGYNVIIVLAGIHNNLRSQTQTRIDEGFLGFDTGSNLNYEIRQTTRIGVGNIAGYNDAIANSYTTSENEGDFNARAANATGLNFDSPEPIILVVKKNASVLNRLHTWLSHRRNNQETITSKSLLIIDDEADNASINTRSENPTLNPTTINRHIRNIIGLFNRSAYVGYTATPFANIFIEAQNNRDLFPRDFIINIPAPSNYIGPEKVFGISTSNTEDKSVLPIVNTISDYHNFIPEGHKKDDDKPSFDSIPESLKTAVKCFIITCAIRRLRNQANKHNSMLIHVSRFQSWQNHIKELVDRLFSYYKQEIEANDSAVIDEFRKIFEENTHNYDSYTTVSSKILNSPNANIDNKIKVHSWEDVKEQLYSTVQKIEVKSINGSSGDVVDYQLNEANGISVIAIGGDKLSRGLTLEGLSVSYFLRASKMYDTLMQMGRWFGYRSGYIDLCRLFTSSELNEWFRHITIASEELRDEFDYLANSGGTPENYALKVRTHPGVLQITATNKMRNATQVQVSWSGRLVETYQLPMDKGLQNQNLVSTIDLFNKLGNPERKGSHYLWKDIPVNVICDYFSRFNLPQSLQKVNLSYINDFINDLVRNGELTSWRVVLLSKEQSSKVYSFDNNINVGCWDRTRAEDINDINTYFIRNNHILGKRQDEFIDLDDDLLSRAYEDTIKEKQYWTHDYPAPEIVRKRYRPKTNPLLIIYPLNPIFANVKDKNGNIIPNTIVYNENDAPIISFAISFPSSETNRAVSYVVNSVGDFRDIEDNFDDEDDNE
jgi:hypothetical protein